MCRVPADIAEGMLQPRWPSGTRETGRAKYLHNLPGHSYRYSSSRVTATQREA